MNRTELDQVKELVKQGNKKWNVTYITGEKRKKRLFISTQGTLCEYAKGASRIGYDFTNTFLNKVCEIKPVRKQSRKEQWTKGINKAIKLLEKSGLWSKLLMRIKKVKEAGYETMQKIREIDRSDYVEDYSLNQKRIFEEMKKVAPQFVETDSDGKEFISTDYRWWFTNPLKFKSMYFGKYQNKQYKEMIKQAIENKRKEHIATTVSYDVSFEYNPECNKAWYSEEYRGCGNGHYYLALDHNTAVHYEDD